LIFYDITGSQRHDFLQIISISVSCLITGETDFIRMKSSVKSDFPHILH